MPLPLCANDVDFFVTGELTLVSLSDRLRNFGDLP
jgi:hypothetical protein